MCQENNRVIKMNKSKRRQQWWKHRDRTGKDRITSKVKKLQIIAQKELSPSLKEGWAKATQNKWKKSHQTKSKLMKSNQAKRE